MISKNSYDSRKAFWLAGAALVALPHAVSAQSVPAAAEDAEASQGDTIVVSGIRASLQSALEEKRRSDNLVEVINAEDVGKLPDQNLAEVLENVTGVQIQRTSGIGTGVQIRGTSANRVEINGNSTVAPGNSRSGISFEDLPAALIASVEVTKVPTAKTIEGSVGGTVNLRTYRGLELKEPLLSFSAQGEYSDLTETLNPRLSGTFGDNWETGIGDIGFVVSASYSEQDVAKFNPRVDRDRVNLPGTSPSSEDFPFLRTQFLQQVIDNIELETLSFTSSLQWEPTPGLRLYVDGTYTDQSQARKLNEAHFSGTGAQPAIDATDNFTFMTVDLGTYDTPNGPVVLGPVQVVESGVIGVGVNGGNGVIDPNLRTVTRTSSRETETYVISGGAEWEMDRLSARFEGQYTESDTVFPDLTGGLDFINPNGPQPSADGSVDNGTPAVFNVANNMLQFGIAPGLATTPTSAQLLDPANYALRSVSIRRDTNVNTETAVRLDLNYDTDGILPFFSSFDVGARWNKSTALNNNSNQNFGYAGDITRPRASLFSDVVSPGYDNFDQGDGRDLFVGDYLVFDPDLAFGDKQAIIDSVNAAITQADPSLNLLGQPTVAAAAFFDISEETWAAYFQGNYDVMLGDLNLRGNLGVRYVHTDVNSIGNNVIGNVVEQTETNSTYEFWLPRFNLVFEPLDGLLIRGGIARDIRRPDFDNLSTSIAFPGSNEAAVQLGNPALRPESVWSYDIGAEYYFSDTGFVSVGFFHKDREDLFGQRTSEPAETVPPGGGQALRDVTPPCEEGGIFNPFAPHGIFGQDGEQGICVPFTTFFNQTGTVTQTGVEVAFQYSLADFDNLGFFSGFGVLANFTYQKADAADEFRENRSGGNALNTILGRTDDDMVTPSTDDDPILQRIPVENLSEYAYNATLFYEKYGFTARARYTWRSFYFLSAQRFGTNRVFDDRGQLNASLAYDVTDWFTLTAEGVNLLREDAAEWCLNDDALLCEQGLTDRRFIVGARLTF